MTNGRLISPAEAANCNPITRRAVGFTPYSGGSVSAAGNVEETPRPVPTAAAHRTTRDSHIKKQSDDALSCVVCQVRGFCDHTNFAVVGMAVPPRVNLFRAQASRAVGGNGRRTSHNPPDRGLLEIYDRVGITVMDENRTRPT